MRRATIAIALAALLCAALAPSAKADFGFKSFDLSFIAADESPSMQAGSHPFALKNVLEVNVDVLGEPEGSPKDLEVDFPPGFVADPTAVPRCTTAEFLTLHLEAPLEEQPSCPSPTALGFIAARAPNEPTAGDFGVAYNMVPPPGKVLKIGFRVLGVFVTVTGGLRPGGHHAFALLENISQAEPFDSSELTIWGNPADPAHDGQRGDCFFSKESCPAGVTPRAFLTLPRSCTGPLPAAFKVRSWQDPGTWVGGPATINGDVEPRGTFGCDALGFAPNVSAEPTTDQAESPSGLNVNLDINDEGLINPEGNAQSDIKKIVTTLPAGMTLNPSAAEGLLTCSPQNLEKETLDSQPGEGCPQASNIGSLEVESPLLEGELLKGQVFVATQDDPATSEPGAENPFDSMLAIYVVIKAPELGIIVKQAGLVEPNEEEGPNAGRLVTTFDDIPQVPFSHLRFHFREGGRSPLITPPSCGTYTTEVEFTPWANPAQTLKRTTDFKVIKGVGGGPCPGGTPPFNPGFIAGTIDNAAGSFSPFYMRLTRADGEQDMTKFSTVLPPGLTGKLAGIAKCPEAAIAAARLKTGRQELAAPSCPANSSIGRTVAGAGVGSQLTYVPGSLYLAGPIGGDPLSVLAVTPAVAGPFDAGTVVVRVALTLNPVTFQGEIDGANSEPIPHILKGIVLKLRDLRVHVDRQNFTLNPTNCEPFSTRATLFGSAANVFSAADDAPVSLASRFQAADCAALDFKPRLSFRLKGGTKRGDHPALTAVVRPRPGEANFKKAVVTLPRSAFLEQAHIRTICTRVQFAAKSCPPGSVYGKATVHTPLLDEPLSGPVYLRSSDHNLPDLVVDLHGLFDVTVSSRIDSHKGGIRNSFEAIPDAPFSRFELKLPAGKKGLIVNSRNLCANPSKATVRFTGQNGAPDNFRAPVKASGCGKSKKK
jgi:hypothetical protein